MSNNKLHLAEALGRGTSDKRVDILKRIGAAGSISEAARQAGVSYKAAWQAVETLSNLAGTPLVEKAVGGTGGGGAQLTEAGHRLLRAADFLATAQSEVLKKLDTYASNDGDGVSALAALGLRTSMRNQLPCRVKAVAHGGSLVRVTMSLADGSLIVARITRESMQLLGLHAGQPVLALFKATAASVARVIEPREGHNQLQGSVTRTSASTKDSEIGLRLLSGLQVVGFARSGHGLKKGDTAVCAIEESGVAIVVSA
jgi:molybdate transport system regulatory protein